MKYAIFGGSFDPVHNEHVRLAVAAKEYLGLDKVFVLPSRVAPHKLGGSVAEGDDRFEMCRIAFERYDWAEASRFEIDRSDTSYTYLTCRYFKERFPQSEAYLLVGADMLENFPCWKRPEEILRSVTLAGCGRADMNTAAYADEIFERFGKRAILVPHTGKAVSSTRIRVELAFGKKPAEIDDGVFSYLQERGLYTHPAILPALALEKPERREHSFRVACLAAENAARFCVSQEKAILASALHDCGKYVPPDSPLLKGFVAPDGVPQPVLHQFTGAYLAEREFGITDEEVLDAIRYHTSGKENMTRLGKLIFVCDMLEEGRTFPGVDDLREALKKGLDEAFFACVSRQVEFLKLTQKEIFPLTERVYRQLKGEN